MTNPNLTEIICIVDRSGSMQQIRDDAIGGFNSFLAEQQKVDKPCMLTYAQFNTTYEIIHNGVDLKSVEPLTHATFVPRGGTALYDAIGRTINQVGARLSRTPEAERPGKVLVVILTDGEENSSEEFTHGTVREMITHQQQTYQWEFLFLAANQDAFVAGTALGMHRNYNFTASGRGVKGIYACAGQSVTSYRLADDAGEACAALDGMSDSIDAPDLDEMLKSGAETHDHTDS